MDAISMSFYYLPTLEDGSCRQMFSNNLWIPWGSSHGFSAMMSATLKRVLMVISTHPWNSVQL